MGRGRAGVGVEAVCGEDARVRGVNSTVEW